MSDPRYHARYPHPRPRIDFPRPRPRQPRPPSLIHRPNEVPMLDFDELPLYEDQHQRHRTHIQHPPAPTRTLRAIPKFVTDTITETVANFPLPSMVPAQTTSKRLSTSIPPPATTNTSTDTNTDVPSKTPPQPLHKALAKLTFGTLLLLAPLWFIAKIKSENGKLGLISGLVVVFVLLLGLGGRRDPGSTLVGAAGYVGVLVVFLGSARS
jgi:hypothetical protein